MGLTIILPVLQIILFCLCIGHDPAEIVISVNNQEMASAKDPCPINHNCTNRTFLSCQFLREVSNKKLKLKYFDTIEEAKHFVQKGEAAVALRIGRNFTKAMDARLAKMVQATKQDVDESLIYVWQDNTSE